MPVRTDCIAPKLMPTSLSMLHRSRLLSHITRVCMTLTFSSAMVSLFLGRPDCPSSSTLSLHPLRLCCPCFYCAIANFIPRFPDMFRFARSPPKSKKNLANYRTCQQRDLYLKKHCRYPMLTSENVRVYIIFGYIRNFNHPIGLIAQYHAPK